MTGSPRTRRVPARAWAVAAVMALAAGFVWVTIQRQRTPAPAVNPWMYGAGEPQTRVSDPFRDIPRDTTAIAWQAWNKATFAAARARGAPLAVLVDAAWSESCILYAGAVAADRAARAALDTVVPVRVDADRRPDVFERYCASSLPAWILLSPRGDVVEVLEAPAPGALARRLVALARDPEPARADPGIDALRAQIPVPPPAADLATAARAAWAALDEALASVEPDVEPDAEWLDGDVLEALAARARDERAAVAARTATRDLLQRTALFAVAHGALDQDVLARADRVQRGRFLATHATWLRHWQRAAAAGDATPAILDAAERTRAWLDSTLWDPDRGLYRGAQGTLVLHDGKPALTSLESARMRSSAHGLPFAPHVVAWYPTAGNARVAVTLLETPVGATDVAARRERGLRIVERLRREWRRAERVPRDFVPDSSGALAPGDCEWLGDAVELGRALLAAAETTHDPHDRARWLTDAAALADLVVERFADPTTGVLLDVPPVPERAPARLRVRLAPLADGARAASFLCDVAASRDDSRWIEPARRALVGWARAVRGHDAWAGASFAAAAERLASAP